MIGKARRVTCSIIAVLTVLVCSSPGQTPTFIRSDITIGNFPVSLAVADLNGDGKLDIAVLANTTSTAVLTIFLGDGSGTFTFKSSFSTGFASTWFTAGDLNGDGLADLVVANSFSRSVSVFLATGSGTFGPRSDISLPGRIESVLLADFNGDGKLDLAAPNFESAPQYSVSILLGKGDGTFGPNTEYPTLDVPFVVVTDDFNNDGKLNLAINGQFGGVSVLLGNGDGTFQPKKDSSTGFAQASHVASGDFNGDGKADLAVANNADNSVSVLLGNGDGTFNLQPPISIPITPSRLAVGDFNGDGFVDLVVARRNSAKVSIPFGKGDGTFLTNAEFDVGAGPQFVTVKDLNGDGKLDVVTANYDAGTISILLNSTLPALNPPSIASVSPTSGTQGQTIPNFTIDGTNFDSNATLSFSGGGITVSTPYLTKTSTQIVASIMIAANAPVGAQDVIVTNPDLQVGKLPGAFTILPPVPPIPGPLPPPPGTGSAGTSQNPQLPLAEPISTGNGNYYYTHTDFVIPGRGLPLAFQRSYNTLDNYSGPLGNNWTHTYNVILTGTSDGTVNIRWGDGHGETFTPSGTAYVNQPGVFGTLVRNPDSTFVLNQKDQTKYNFSATGRLTAIRDRNGNTIQLTYNVGGNLTQITDTGGRTVMLSYDVSNRITQLTDPLGRAVTFQYSSTNDLVAETDSAGGVTRFAYDANHRVTSITLPTGNVLLQNTYDGPGRVTSQTNGRGAAIALTYDVPNPGDRTITDARGNHTVHTYDASLRIAKVTDALSGTTRFTYDASNDRTSITNPNGETTNFSYDSRGNITSITDPLANTIQFTYDARNDLLAATNAKGKTTTFSYDANGNLSTVQDALANPTTFGYDGFGELTLKTDARGQATNFAYDSAGNLTRITDALGKATNLTYDAIGRLLSITDPNAHTATASYDLLNRLMKIADPLGNQTQFVYDAVGNLVKITDAKGSATSYVYDATNNLVSVTDALGRVTRYAYDANNNRVTFTNAKGNANSYAYDSLNRLSAITDPLSFVTTYAYDGVGNVTSINDANGRTNQFVYDALNRLLGISYAEGNTVAYSYDANGNRTSMADSHGLTSYSYDDLDRLTSVNHPGGKLVTYAYDAVGNRVSLGYPDGKVATYAYDAANRLSQATDWLARSTSYTYDAASNLTKILYPNKTSMGFPYDSASRLTSVVNTALGSPLLTLAYGLDPVGNRISLSVNGVKTTFAYDTLNELLSAQLGPLKSAWTYDSVGNRTKETSPLGTTQYTYDRADRLLSAGATAFTYDRNGNQLTKTTRQGTVAYAYDAANRLVSASARGMASTYAYDGDGNRVTQTTSAGTYNYVNDVATALPVVLNEQGPDGNITYAYGLGLIEEASPSFNYFYHYDGLGSVIALTDATGKPRAAYAYDAWGNPLLTIPDSVGTKNKFRFTGEALDPGTGLYYLRARYYDPSVGRFISRDPFWGWVRTPKSLQGFPYAYNNPANRTDRSGLSSLGSTSVFTASIVTSASNAFGRTRDTVAGLFHDFLCGVGSILQPDRLPGDVCGITESAVEIATNEAPRAKRLSVDKETILSDALFVLDDSKDPMAIKDAIAAASGPLGTAPTVINVAIHQKLEPLLKMYQNGQITLEQLRATWLND